MNPEALWDVGRSLCVPALGLLAYPWVLGYQRRAALPWATATVLASALALALAYVQAGAMLLGFTHTLRAGWVAAWIVAGAAASIAYGIATGTFLPKFRLGPGTAWLPWLLWAGWVAATLAYATVPPWRRDEMVYHLALPRLFALAGGYAAPDDNIFASFPLAWESIQGALHALGRAPDHFAPFNPRLLGAWTATAASLATAGLARSAGASTRAAAWAAVAIWCVPDFFQFGGSAYVEPYLVLLTTLALTGVALALQGAVAALWPAALFAGLAASTKYPGLAAGGLLFLIARLGVPNGRTPAWKFAGLAACVGAPFYVRNLVERGNPFFPLAFHWFGGRGWDEGRQVAYAQTLADYGMGRGLWDWLSLPWRFFTATDLRGAFEGAVGVGPALGFALGGALVLWRPLRGNPVRVTWWALWTFAAAWFCFWAATVQQARFFLVAVPALCALACVGAEALWTTTPRWSRWTGRGVLFAATAWSALPVHAAWAFQETTPWLLGRVSRDQVLSTMLPEHYALEPRVEALVPANGKVWLVWTRNFTYYFKRPYRLDCVFEGYRFEALLDESGDDEAFVAQLRTLGVTHLLINHRFFLAGDNADTTPGRTERLRQRFSGLVDRGALAQVMQEGPVALYQRRP